MKFKDNSIDNNVSNLQPHPLKFKDNSIDNNVSNLQPHPLKFNDNSILNLLNLQNTLFCTLHYICPVSMHM